MSNKAVGIGLFVCVALLCCLALWGKAQQPTPQPFPRPADVGAVRMHFIGGHMTIYAPSDKVTTKPGMDKATTVIDIDTTPVVVTPKSAP
jgi:hypothetical protein